MDRVPVDSAAQRSLVSRRSKPIPSGTISHPPKRLAELFQFGIDLLLRGVHSMAKRG